MIPPDEFADCVIETRQRTCELVADLSDEQLEVPMLPELNPLLWELGHAAWFQEKWLFRREGEPSMMPHADALYDSAAIAHDTRWDLPLPNRAATLRYVHDVRDRVLELLRGEVSPELAYFIRLTIFHEDMHAEAFTYTRQTLAYPAPRFSARSENGRGEHTMDRCSGDVEIPGGVLLLGATSDEPFVFDNEKWAHPVNVAAFAMARAAVTQGEFAAFVDDGGYHQERFWTADGWQWRQSAEVTQPSYWQRVDNRWQRRHFDQHVPLEPDLAMMHVNWHEATAYCNWAGRRLPTEAEWELAAATERGPQVHQRAAKHRYPWGDEAPRADQANLDWRHCGPVPVAAYAQGDSGWGCRQMIGNVWEWTASDFLPYPGFTPDPYKEYSAPVFGTRKVLRGGSWASRGRMLRNTWRNFYRPERRDIFAGFRTCACS